MAEYPIAPEAIRHLRYLFRLAPREMARALRIGRTSVHRFETIGAPPWALLALGGLGILRYGYGVAEIAAHLGLDPDADPPRNSAGTFAPVFPTRERPPLSPESAEPPAPPYRPRTVP